MCCLSNTCQCPNKKNRAYSIYNCEYSSKGEPYPFYFNRLSPDSMDIRPTWRIYTTNTDICTCSIPPAEEKLFITPYTGDDSCASYVSFGETEGLYPQKEPLYDPSKWNVEKTKELLKCRAAIHLVGSRGETVRKNWPSNVDNFLKRLLPYHLTINFPSVDNEIKNDTGVKWFYLSPEINAIHTGINREKQEIVKAYGPFYNVGGGDVKRGDVYVIFYRIKP